MNRTLLPLLLLSILLVAVLAPHATLTLTAVILLSAIVTRGSWAVIQAFAPASEAYRPMDRR